MKAQARRFEVPSSKHHHSSTPVTCFFFPLPCLDLTVYSQRKESSDIYRVFSVIAGVWDKEQLSVYW